MILVGGFVKAIGRDDIRLTLEHFATAFGVEWRDAAACASPARPGTPSAPRSRSRPIAAPLTAAIGLLTAYLLDAPALRRPARVRVRDHAVSFAIPGTVIGVSYILAFNVPPIELTGTGAILVICFVFRNMPVGVRAGIAALTQIDKSLDEASLTLARLDLAHAAARRAAAAAAGDRRRAGLQLRARDDRGQRGDLPGHRAVQPGHRLHRRPRRGRRVRPRHRLLVGPDRVMLVAIAADPALRRRAPARPARAAPTSRRRRRRRDAWPSTTRPASSSSDAVTKRYGDGRGRRRRLVHDRARHAGHAARPVGLRQDDDAAHDRRARAGEQRARS